MDITIPKPAISAEAIVGLRRSRAFWGAVAVGLGLSIIGVGVLAWPDSAVVLETTPSGAEVLVDGRGVGQTPLRLAARPGPFRARVEARLTGHQSWSGPLSAGLGESRTLALTLEPLPGSVSLASTPAGAQVTVDGRAVGRTPLAIDDLAPGEHTVTLALEGYDTWQAAIRTEPGEELERTVQLVARAQAPSIGTPDDRDTKTAANGSSPPAGGASDLLLAPAASITAPARPPVEPLPSIAPPHAEADAEPVAIMIENTPDARPQSGLAGADIVYEAMAEGGISRFMAVYFAGDDSAPVGPVRSARHYFVNLAAELQASMVHVGSSPQGYAALREVGLRSLDETYAHPGFWRSRARFAPHNAYTSLRAARQALATRGSAGPGSWAGFTFKAPERTYEARESQRLLLDYQPWGYVVEYRFDPASGRYARFMAGAPHRDAESGEQLAAASVAVLRVSTWVIDAEGRLDMDQVSQGPAAYFMDGVVIEGTWRKEAPGEPTRFLDADGNPIRFNPGPIWVQLIAYEGKVEF